MNDKLKEIMSSKDKFINEINKNGFNILEKYKVYDCKFENNLIDKITFELINNPLDEDWDWNGCITLIFEYINNEIACQIQFEAVTETIDYSDFAEYNNRMYYEHSKDREDMPSFKNESSDYGFDSRCYFSDFYDTKYYKTTNIFKKITKYIEEADSNIEDCINTQDEINEFEVKYYEKVLEVEFDKDIDEITDEEIEEYNWEQAGIRTYNMMVSEGWLDED